MAQIPDRREWAGRAAGAAAWGRGTAWPQPGVEGSLLLCGSRKLGTVPAQGNHCQKARSSGLLSVLVCFAQGRNHERWDSVLKMILEPIGKQPLLPGQFTAAV